MSPGGLWRPCPLRPCRGRTLEVEEGEGEEFEEWCSPCLLDEGHMPWLWRGLWNETKWAHNEAVDQGGLNMILQCPVIDLKGISKIPDNVFQVDEEQKGRFR